MAYTATPEFGDPTARYSRPILNLILNQLPTTRQCNETTRSTGDHFKETVSVRLTQNNWFGDQGYHPPRHNPASLPTPPHPCIPTRPSTRTIRFSIRLLTTSHFVTAQLLCMLQALADSLSTPALIRAGMIRGVIAHVHIRWLGQDTEQSYTHTYTWGGLLYSI